MKGINMLVTTTENIPGKSYEIIGTVYSNRTMSLFAKTEIAKAEAKMIEEAKSQGADAIVCVRIFTTANGGTGIFGTAVKYK
jgi:uncharacterized protein YbjQ (UPF0145 family)